MKDLVYLSRAFVEFGPFTKAEILDFQKRGMLSAADYLRDEASDTWLHYQEWLTIVPMPAPKLVKKPAPAPAKAPAAKKSKKAA
ncbi:MAG: hypothetical protein ACKVY0_13355 [Prosthecobacter sp.]|uniref:hypothetical protein n=1 Tax=Prosthecobacter sp. TaxID=1965333 RepID=UPI0039009284